MRHQGENSQALYVEFHSSLSPAVGRRPAVGQRGDLESDMAVVERPLRSDHLESSCSVLATTSGAWRLIRDDDDLVSGRKNWSSSQVQLSSEFDTVQKSMLVSEIGTTSSDICSLHEEVAFHGQTCSWFPVQVQSRHRPSISCTNLAHVVSDQLAVLT